MDLPASGARTRALVLGPRPIPAELDAALAQDDEARERWASFTPGRQRSLAIYVAEAKRPASREKRALDLAHKLRTFTLYGDPPP